MSGPSVHFRRATLPSTTCSAGTGNSVIPSGARNPCYPCRDVSHSGRQGFLAPLGMTAAGRYLAGPENDNPAVPDSDNALHHSLLQLRERGPLLDEGTGRRG